MTGEHVTLKCRVILALRPPSFVWQAAPSRDRRQQLGGILAASILGLDLKAGKEVVSKSLAGREVRFVVPFRIASTRTSFSAVSGACAPLAALRRSVAAIVLG